MWQITGLSRTARLWFFSVNAQRRGHLGQTQRPAQGLLLRQDPKQLSLFGLAKRNASYLRERNFWPRRRDARSFVNGPNSRTAHQLDGTVPRGPTCSRNLWTTNVLYIPSALSLQYRSFSPKTRLVSRRRNSEPAVACSLGPWSPTRALRGEGCRIQNLLLWLA
jgi:hypothetical protein